MELSYTEINALYFLDLNNYIDYDLITNHHLEIMNGYTYSYKSAM